MLALGVANPGLEPSGAGRRRHQGRRHLRPLQQLGHNPLDLLGQGILIRIILHQGFQALYFLGNSAAGVAKPFFKRGIAGEQVTAQLAFRR